MSAKKIKFISVCLLAMFSLSACSPFKPDPRDGMTMGVPLNYKLYSKNSRELGKWWEAFENRELNKLVEEAVIADFDVRIAWAKLRQLRATAVKSRADLYPKLDGKASYTDSMSGNDGTEGKKGSTSTDVHKLGLAASYEIDFWGKIEAESASGELDFLVSREDVNTAAMTVASEVVKRWLEIQLQRRKKVILQKQLETNETYLELIELRFRNSLATALDVYQQREAVARTKALIPPVESREQILLHELAHLLGRPAGSVAVLTADFPVMPKMPGLGIPLDLLANRPDVRAAGLKLQSSDWAVTAARADRLPTVSLSAEAALSSAQLANIFSGWMTSLAASVVGPIFDGFARKAEVERTRAVVDERLLNYKEAVYTAFKEVQDSLVQEKWQREYIKARKNQLEAAKINLSEAGSRYIQGLDDYLPVLNALVSVQTLEISIAEDEMNLFDYRVSLYRALGGSWTDSLVATDELKPESEDEKVIEAAGNFEKKIVPAKEGI
ncbi:efflux transporter outer membrane subunit [Maridesulfovibrio zosterae]|uniref:efflux transporter outer membrane subunit n=1 Tax=Maridesulfovibrio zosterae TaxID=82171 RepID=UPI0004184F8B|nr:efflux transporter outer membrane subunit [Maridesulfovibrio zosterae]